MKMGTYNQNTFTNSPMTIGDGNYITNIVNSDKNELDAILQGIGENLFRVSEEDADNIKDIAEMAKEELAKPEPRVSRLKNCLTLIAPMFTIANGVPALANNLQKLVNYITAYIKN